MSPWTIGVLVSAWALGCDGGASAPGATGSAGPSDPSATISAQGTGAAQDPSSAATAASATAASATAASAAAASASAPPAPGAIAKLQDEARRDPDTFNGKHVRVEGLYVGTSRRDIGPLVGDSYHPLLVVDVLIADAKDDREHTIPCEMTVWKPPPGLAELDRVTVEGRGYIDTPANGRRLVIGSCTLARSAGDPPPQ